MSADNRIPITDPDGILTSIVGEDESDEIDYLAETIEEQGSIATYYEFQYWRQRLRNSGLCITPRQKLLHLFKTDELGDGHQVRLEHMLKYACTFLEVFDTQNDHSQCIEIFDTTTVTTYGEFQSYSGWLYSVVELSRSSLPRSAGQGIQVVSEAHLLHHPHLVLKCTLRKPSELVVGLLTDLLKELPFSFDGDTLVFKMTDVAGYYDS